MPTTTIRTPPPDGDFTPLSEYEAQTPETFFGGKPILHSKVMGAKCWIPKSQCGKLPVFPADYATSSPSGPEGEAASGAAGEALTEQDLDVWVSSENFTLFNQQAQVGVTIPYPSISIHALKTVGQEENKVYTVWMQLELVDGGDGGDDDFSTIELTLVTPVPTDPTTHEAEAKRLYDAISNCSNLHPDPANEDEEDDEEGGYGRIVFEGDDGHAALDGFTGVMQGSADGGLPPPMPGSSGWITAENVHEYFDTEGNWIGGDDDGGVSGELGDGAGRVRSRGEAEDSTPGALNADQEDVGNSEIKRPRVG